MPPVRPKTAAKAPEIAPEMVFAVDGRDAPIAVMPLSEVHRQGLSHRSVLVLVHNPVGKLYLQRRAKTKSAYPGCYDLSATGHVRAFESRYDAAMREVFEELALIPQGLKLLSQVPASAATGFEFVTLFSAGKIQETPRPDPSEVEDGFFASPEDIEDLVEHFRDRLTPGLLHFHELGLLFPAK